MPSKLGQNFLNDIEVVEKIIQEAEVSPSDLVLEIGPGKGILTQKLLNKGAKVLAVEIDKNLISQLQNNFANEKNLRIVSGNILDLKLSQLFDSDSKYKLIANIPYYITSAIIRKFLEEAPAPEEIFLMIQKEVAERIVEKPGNMSLLSISVQYYARAEIIFEVSKDKFFPKPKVDSAVIKIAPKDILPEKEEAKKFFQIARSGFSNKRKTLLNNLSNSLHLEKDFVLEILEREGLSKNTRAQELSIENWKSLSKRILS